MRQSHAETLLDFCKGVIHLSKPVLVSIFSDSRFTCAKGLAGFQNLVSMATISC